MNIKALIFDLDGTAIPNRPDGMPSKRVIDAVLKAKEKILVSVATGRPSSICRDVLSALYIEAPCIVSGGTQLYEPSTENFIWEQRLQGLSIQQIVSLCADFPYQIVSEDEQTPVPIKDFHHFNDRTMLCIFNVTPEDSKKIIKILSRVEAIAAHPVSSWKSGTFDIHITHELATKKHAMQALLLRERLHTDEVMVVGDGGNDLPLFELAGLKIAMGNASKELKEKADWIAPSVDDDGLAIAIEKYILT